MTAPELTEAQQLAASTVDLPLCILAGAGSGKTGVLAAHYLALLTGKKLKPSEIVAVSFTEKAAGELKERIQRALLGTQNKNQIDFQMILEDFDQSPITTLHGLALRIVREGALLSQISPQFSVLNEEEAWLLQQRAVTETLQNAMEQPSPPLDALLQDYGFSEVKRQLIKMLQSPSEWKAASTKNWETLQVLFESALNLYQRRKTETEVLDFNDLEEKATKLLKTHPQVAKHYRSLWKAFLVDEFQDTNLLQDRFLSLLLGHTEEGKLAHIPHLAIVGDPKQSIYAFRGARPELFEHYRKKIETSGGKTVFLNRNFRSQEPIVHFVNRLSAQFFPNDLPLEAHLPTHPSSPAIEVLISPLLDEKQKMTADEKRSIEANALARRVRDLINEGTSPSDIFFLFRSMTAVGVYQKALQALQISVYVRSRASLLDRQEVLDLIHALRVVADPASQISWMGLLRSPALGWSDEALLHKKLKDQNYLDASWATPLTDFFRTQTPQTSTHSFLKTFLERTQLLSIYNSIPEAKGKAENILQFLKFSYDWEQKNTGGIQKFLEEIDMWTEQNIPLQALSDVLGGEESVTLMTIHQSKGLNLPIVILPNLEASPRNTKTGIVERFEEQTGVKTPEEHLGLGYSFKPSESFLEIQNLNQRREEEEEKRILYVATTRAERKIIFGFLPKKTSSKENSCRHTLAEILQKEPGVFWIKSIESESVAASSSHFLPQQEIMFEKPLSEDKKSSSFHVQKTRFSVTALECFLSSTEEYIRRHLQHLPQEAEDFHQNSTPELTPLQRGEIIHAALCQLTQPHQKLSIHQIVENLLSRPPLSIRNTQRTQELSERIEQIDCHPHFQKIRNPQEGYSEIPFLLRLGQNEIRGAIDRLILTHEGWTVIDYKTHGLPNSEPNTLRIVAKNFEFQMKTYCLAASRMMGKPVLKAEVYFVMIHQSYAFLFDENELIKHENFLTSTIEKIQILETNHETEDGNL